MANAPLPSNPLAVEMTQHAFGGRWTIQKLEILRNYLSFYTTALKAQRFRLIYIDAFAGTGRCTVQVQGSDLTIPGSANIALDTEPPFSSFHFIEKKPKHVRALNDLLARHARGASASVATGSASEQLRLVLASQDWATTRGVLFLDPYGLQCDWQMLETIAATKALDVFFLVSLSGLYRQATNNLRDADESKIEALGRFLGTGSWVDELYSVQDDLFSAPERTRHADPYAIAKFVKARLETLFPKVTEPVILYGSAKNGKRGAPMFALFFAVSNPATKAVELASRVSRDIMSKLG